MLVFSQTITAAVSAQLSQVFQFRDGVPEAVSLEGTFTYGSGGTSVDAWVQGSADGGATWGDLANFHFTTASGRSLFNLSALSVAGSPVTLTDGSLAANTSGGIWFGTLVRVKYTTVGTYAGGTLLRVDVTGRGRLVPLLGG